MHFIPLIYFTGLSFYLWSKNKAMDLSVYMSSLYALTALCSELMIMLGQTGGSGVLADGWEMNFGFIPTVLYCALITLTILPFSLIRVEKLKEITSNRRIILYCLTILIVLQSILMLYLLSSCISELFTSNLKDLKNTYYSGELSPMDAKMLLLPIPLRLLFYTSSLTLFALPLFFYFTCVEKRNVLLCLPLIIVSLTYVFKGIIIADRTEIILWGLMFIFCLIMFRNIISKPVFRTLSFLSIPFAGVALVYFLAVSSDRFDTKDESGAGNSILMYAGQSYMNFCYFYDNHDPNLYYLEREFPLTSMALFHTTYVDTKEERTAKEGFFVGVFATHVGSWLLDSGVYGAFFFSCAFAFICLFVIRKYNRREFSIEEILLLYTLGTIPTFGIFYYRFYHYAIALQYVVAGLLYINSRYRVVWNGSKNAGHENKQ